MSLAFSSKRIPERLAYQAGYKAGMRGDENNPYVNDDPRNIAVGISFPPWYEAAWEEGWRDARRPEAITEIHHKHQGFA